MGSMTVRKIDDEVMRDLRISAAKRGVSMEQEARDRLRRPLQESENVEMPTSDSVDVQTRVNEILAFGRRLPKVDFDQKQVFDELYEYLDRE